MSPASVENSDLIVVTCRVPCSDLAELELTVAGQSVGVTGPAGFRHELDLPDADMANLSVELFRNYLELRAPRRPHS
jgi:hypothetical protein